MTAQFYDSNGFYKTVSESQYTFMPYIALVIGEDPAYVVEINGEKYTFLSYPLPNETFTDISLTAFGSPASSVEVYTFEYSLSNAVPTSVTQTTIYVYGESETAYNIYAFVWLYSGAHITLDAYDVTSGSFSQINGTVTF